MHNSSPLSRWCESTIRTRIHYRWYAIIHTHTCNIYPARFILFSLSLSFFLSIPIFLFLLFFPLFLFFLFFFFFFIFRFYFVRFLFQQIETERQLWQQRREIRAGYTLRGCLRADRCRPDSSDNGRDILKNWGQRCEQRQRNASPSSVFLLPLYICIYIYFFFSFFPTAVPRTKRGRRGKAKNKKGGEGRTRKHNVHRFTINTLDISNFELRANIRKCETPFPRCRRKGLNELYDEIFANLHSSVCRFFTVN